MYLFKNIQNALQEEYDALKHNDKDFENEYEEVVQKYQTNQLSLKELEENFQSLKFSSETQIFTLNEKVLYNKIKDGITRKLKLEAKK